MCSSDLYTVSSDATSCIYFNGTLNASMTCGVNLTMTSSEGSNTWIVYANDSSQNQNSSSVTFLVDTQYPTFSSDTTNNATYSGQYARFNVTIENTNGTVQLELNGINYTANNLTSNIYNVTVNLTTLGNYQYYWNSWGNGSINYYNISSLNWFSVNQTIVTDTTPPYFTTIPDNTSIDYLQPIEIIFNATDETSFSDWSINWTEKFTINQTGGLINSTPLGVGIYLINVTINDSSNNINFTIFELNITSIDPTLSLTITPSTSETYGTETTATGSGCPSELTCTLNLNTTGNTANPHTATLGAQQYLYNYSTSGNENYTGDSTTDTLIISKATGIVFAYINESRADFTMTNTTATSCENINLNATLDTGDSNIAIELYNNNSLINTGTSPLSNLTKDRKSTRLNSSHIPLSRMPSSA